MNSCCIEIRSSQDLIGKKSYLWLPSYIDKVVILDPLREEIIRKAVDLLLRNQHVLIVGDPGVGKTTLLYFIWKEIAKRGIKTCYVPYNVSRIPEFDGIILIDDILVNYRDALRSVLQVRQGTILATARRGELKEIMDILRMDQVSFRDIFNVLELKPFLDPALIRDVFLRHINENGLILDKRYSDAIIEQVVKKSEGYPVYIYMLVNDALSEGRRRITLSFVNSIPKGLSRYVETTIQRIVRDIPAVMDKMTVLNSALLTLYIMAKYIVGGIHIDLLHGLLVTAYSRLKHQKITHELILSMTSALERIVRHLVKVGKYTYMFPHRVWNNVLLNPKTSILGVSMYKLEALFGEQNLIDILNSAYLFAYTNITEQHRDEERIDEYLNQSFMVELEAIPTLKGARKIEAEKPEATIEREAEIRVVEKPTPEQAIPAKIEYSPPVEHRVSAENLPFPIDFVSAGPNVVIYGNIHGKLLIKSKNQTMLRMIPRKIQGLVVFGGKIIYYYWGNIYIANIESPEKIIGRETLDSAVRKVISDDEVYILTESNTLYRIDAELRIRKILEKVIDFSVVMVAGEKYIVVLDPEGFLNIYSTTNLKRVSRIRPPITTKHLAIAYNTSLIGLQNPKEIAVISPKGSQILYLNVPTEKIFIIRDRLIYPALDQEGKENVVILRIPTRTATNINISNDKIIDITLLDDTLVVCTTSKILKIAGS